MVLSVIVVAPRGRHIRPGNVGQSTPRTQIKCNILNYEVREKNGFKTEINRKAYLKFRAKLPGLQYDEVRFKSRGKHSIQWSERELMCSFITRNIPRKKMILYLKIMRGRIPHTAYLVKFQ